MTHNVNSDGSPRLLDQVRNAIQVRHYSIRTEQAYVHWIKKYIYFHKKKHPKDMGDAEITAFLSYLATTKNVSASTQNQALNALVFLYRKVLETDVGVFKELVRAKKPKRLPVVLTHDESIEVLSHIQGMNGVMANLLYGSGLRLMECVRLVLKILILNLSKLRLERVKAKKIGLRFYLTH